MPVQYIASKIKFFLFEFDEKKMYQQMAQYYKLLHLMDDNGQWLAPELQKISTQLLPVDFTLQKTLLFIDEMAALAEKNPYLLNFLNQAKKRNFNHLAQKVTAEGSMVFPKAVALANVLERLTLAMYEDYKILVCCFELFQKARKELKPFKNMRLYCSFHRSLFYKTKLLSVEFAIKKIIDFHKSKTLPPNFTRYALPLNILEALVSDYLNDFKANATQLPTT